MSSVVILTLREKTGKPRSETGIIQKILNQTSALTYVPKNIQLSAFLPNFLLCIIDKSHRGFQELQEFQQNSKPINKTKNKMFKYKDLLPTPLELLNLLKN